MKTKKQNTNKANSTANKTVEQINKQRADNRAFLNQTWQCTGKRYTNQEERAFGFTEVRVWNPIKQQIEVLTAHDEDRFIVTAETYDLAVSEFWNRWKLFVSRAFKLSYLRIESPNTPYGSNNINF